MIDHYPNFFCTVEHRLLAYLLIAIIVGELDVQ
jgi:hypothetical protein